MDLINLSTFLMYMTGINVGVYVILLILFVYFRNGFVKLHLRMLRIADKHKSDIEKLLLGWIARYELLIIVFNIVPLISVYLMTS